MSDWKGWTYSLNSNSSVYNTYCLGSALDRPNGFTRKSGMVVAISTLKTIFPSNSRKDWKEISWRLLIKWIVQSVYTVHAYQLPRSLWTLLLSLRLKKLGRKFYQSPIKSNFCFIAIPLGGLEQDFLVSSISIQ